MDDKEVRQMAQIEWFKNRLQHHETLTNAVIAFEHALLRGSIVLNGGAMIAMLTLYGAVVSARPVVYWPLIAWTVGLGLCAVAAVLAALSQWQFQILAGRGSSGLAKQFFDLEMPGESVSYVSNKCAGQALRVSALILWFSSVVAFVVGSLAAAFQLPT